MSLRPYTAPRNPGFMLHWPHTCYPKHLAPKYRPLTSHTPHAGEAFCAEPPPPLRTVLHIRQHRVNHSSGLRMPRWCSTAKSQAKPSPGVPDRPTPASPSAAPPQEATAGDPAPPHPAPFDLSRPIGSERPRLDREPLRPQPSGRDRTDQIRRYPFGWHFFSKGPLQFPVINPQSM
jgi:hypothetical protein